MQIPFAAHEVIRAELGRATIVDGRPVSARDIQIRVDGERLPHVQALVIRDLGGAMRSVSLVCLVGSVDSAGMFDVARFLERGAGVFELDLGGLVTYRIEGLDVVDHTRFDVDLREVRVDALGTDALP